MTNATTQSLRLRYAVARRAAIAKGMTPGDFDFFVRKAAEENAFRSGWGEAFDQCVTAHGGVAKGIKTQEADDAVRDAYEISSWDWVYAAEEIQRLGVDHLC